MSTPPRPKLNVIPFPTTRVITIEIIRLRSDTSPKDARKIIESQLAAAYDRLHEIEDYYLARGPEPFLRPIIRKPKPRPRARRQSA